MKVDLNTLIIILKEHDGVDLISLGKARDGFTLPVDVPHWTSGLGGQYEMVHKHVPEGVMVAVSGLDGLKGDFDTIREKLRTIDMYPTGHDGDFAHQDVSKLRQWFFDRSIRNDKQNGQEPLADTAHALTPEKFDATHGAGKFNELVEYLADEMQILKDPKQDNALVPASHAERRELVKELLNGIASTVRYTRIDGPAKGYQFSHPIEVQRDGGLEEGGSSIRYLLEDINKIIVLRTDPKTGETIATPLDKQMLGVSYDTKDGKPMGARGTVSIREIIERAQELETMQIAREYLGTLREKGFNLGV